MSDASLGQMLAEWIESVRVESLPADVVRGCADTVIDTVGLSLAARKTDYVAALREACLLYTSPSPRDRG